jgi:hypothetical protein
MADKDIMAMMQSGTDSAPPPGSPPPATPAPMPSPMSTPEPKNGQRDAALINVSMAMDLLEGALPAVGSETPEGQKLISAISALTNVLGPKKQKAGELQNAEILQLMQNLPQAGGGTPGSRAMASAPPNLGLMNAPAPAGAPPSPAGGMPPMQGA